MSSVRSAARICIGFSLVTILGLPLLGQEVPFLGGRVNDTAEMLSLGTVNELEALLQEHETATSNQVVVLTIPRLEELTLEEFSMKVASTWKLGQADKDNGVLLLIAKEDRKLRIEVGDGLESVLTDAATSSIIRNEITPRFREGNFDAGVKAGVQAILAAISGEYVATGQERSPGMDPVALIIGMLVFMIVIGIFTLVAIFTKGFMSWFLYVFIMPFWLAFPYAFLGTVIPAVIYAVAFPVLKILLARNQSLQKSMATWSEAWSWSHAIRGGGSRGWSSGGGFSGGGGSFSGGGSSGSW